MATLHPHINFNGNAREAFEFYRSVFGGEFSRILYLKELAGPDVPIADEDADKLLHIALPVGTGMLIGNDVPSFLGRVNEQENRSKISVRAGSRDEADRLYHGLSHGGTVEAPIGESPWGTYFGMFRDKYGIEWIVETDR
ncbi:MAG: VOC family protein [Bacteroidia bacterium]|nr:VOC family protein [Bacteroidia bacterium]